MKKNLLPVTTSVWQRTGVYNTGWMTFIKPQSTLLNAAHAASGCTFIQVKLRSYRPWKQTFKLPLSGLYVQSACALKVKPGQRLTNHSGLEDVPLNSRECQLILNRSIWAQNKTIKICNCIFAHKSFHHTPK